MLNRFWKVAPHKWPRHSSKSGCSVAIQLAELQCPQSAYEFRLGLATSTKNLDFQVIWSPSIPALSEKCPFFYYIQAYSRPTGITLWSHASWKLRFSLVGQRSELNFGYLRLLEFPLNIDLNQPEKASDRELLSHFARTGSQEAFARLIARHGPMVLRVCQRVLADHHEAEDAFQAVFLVLAKKSGKMSWNESIANWLYGVTWRVARRSARRRSKMAQRLGDLNEISQPQLERSAEIEAAEEVLYPALYKLPEKYRAPLILCYLQGKTRCQAADELNVSESTVKGRLERGRDMLRRRLSKSELATLTVFTSGLIAGQVAQAAISQTTLTSLARDATSFQTSTASSVVSLNSTLLAQGEISKMLILSRLKIALLAVTLLVTGGFGALLTQQTILSGEQASVTALADQWGELDDLQRELLTKRHLQAILYAVHAYVDDNNGMLPPAAVPNPNLPMEKRLSGLVLLLPYLGVRPSYLAEDDPAWLDWHADNQKAREAFDQIDLTKAWDDPANAAAAKVLVPEFLSPTETEFRDQQGRGLAHFAFVRGSRGRDNGMFPLVDQAKLAIPDINDGTVNTMAMGQVHDQPGPWIAAGASTARFLDPPGEQPQTKGFGSRHSGAAWFANGDGYTYFLDVAATYPRLIHALAGRNDGQPFNQDGLARFTAVDEWLQSKNP